MDRSELGLQHLSLSTAAATVHIKVTGRPPDASKSAEMRDVLNDVARAMSSVVPIHALNPGTGGPIEIPSAELTDGKFLLGARLLITKDGKEYRGLTVQRRDMNTAIVVLQRAGAANHVVASKENETKSDRPTRTGSLSILIVDENVDAAHTLGMLCEQQGHHCELAYDGITALHAARRTRPEVIFLDLEMPGMDGFEVARRLRQDLAFRDVLIVAVTGFGGEEDRRRTREAGIDHHVVKPADPAFIESLLRRLR